MPFIDKNSPEPLYVQVQTWMKQKINSGEWGPQHKLLSEIDLAASLEISRGTIKQAIKNLIDEGVLVQIHGKGTFVVGRQIESPVAERLVSIAETLDSNNNEFSTVLLGIELIPAVKPFDQHLGLSKGESLYFLRRVRSFDHCPVVYLENYLPAKLFPNLDKYNFEKETLFSIIERDYGLSIRRGKRSFVACGSDERISSLLEIDEGTPIILLEQVTFSSDNAPLEYSKVWLRSDRMKLTSILERS
ncbi:GntR family transcriptional regulator [Paenibacillus sp. GCM10027626]|uniref:GntR family transcriptional regulator n=1 Tax=Paenibacillus sp. GCM10027626 TaxID=3273411 RepID=UPI003645714F